MRRESALSNRKEAAVSGGGIYTALAFVGGLSVATIVIVHAATAPELTEVSGRVTASCETLQVRKLPQVFTVEGEQLPGKAWMSDTLGTGPCRASVRISDVPKHDRYRVRLGSMSDEVDAAQADGGVELTDERSVTR
jgi:hypothetical protein